jgi:hypothetical protein
MKKFPLILFFSLAICANGLGESILVVPTRLAGDVKLSPQDGKPYSVIDKDSEIIAGKSIRTGKDGDAAFWILPGARIQLPAGSEIRVDNVDSGEIQETTTTSFVPVGSAIKSILTNNDGIMTEAGKRVQNPAVKLTLFTGAIRSAIVGVNYRVNLPAGYLVTNEAIFASTIEPSGCERLSVSSGQVTFTMPDGNPVEVTANTFVRLCRSADGFELVGPLRADEDADSLGDLAVLRGQTGEGLEAVAEYKEALEPKEGLSPVKEFLPPLLFGSASPVGFGFSAPFDLPPLVVVSPEAP